MRDNNISKSESVTTTLKDLDYTIQTKVANFISTKYKHLTHQKSSIMADWAKIENTVKRNRNLVVADTSSLVCFHTASHNTILSHIWARALQTPNMLCNVVGMDENSQKNAPLYKANLMDLLNKDKFTLKQHKCLDLDFITKGVMIGKISYKLEEQEKTIPVHLFPTLNPSKVKEPHYTDDGNVRYKTNGYDGATFERVNPRDFVFDHTRDWDRTFKCERSFAQWEDLKAQNLYNNLEDVKPRLQTTQTDFGNSQSVIYESGKSSVVNSEYRNNGMVELMTAVGDFKIDDNLYLSNYLIVIANSNTVIRLEPNPFMFNPYVKVCYMETEDGWGESILLATCESLYSAAKLANLGTDAAELAIMPALIGPKGLFGDRGKISISPGAYIGYEINPALANHKPEPIPVNPNAGLEYIQYFEQQIEATTGATRQLSGATTTNDSQQTATEFQGLQSMGNLLLDRVVDIYNLEFKLPLIEKFAMLTGFFNPVERDLPVHHDNGSKVIERIPEEAYYGEYQFQIDDSKSEMERKQAVQQKMSFLQMCMQIPQLAQRINWIDVAKSEFTDLGYGDPDSLFLTDDQMMQQQQGMQNMLQGQMPTQNITNNTSTIENSAVNSSGNIGVL